MDSNQSIFLLLLFSTLIISDALSQPIPQNHLHLFSGTRKLFLDDLLYCKSWGFTVEANNANPWITVPLRCAAYVKDYFTQGQYWSDLDWASDNALVYAKTINIRGDGKDVWVFDIDETLLSNLPYFAVHGFGTEPLDGKAFTKWIDLAECPALQASLRLYNELLRMGFTIVLLTGRYEDLRNITVENLTSVGYHDWERLILRGPSDHRKPAVVYKSEKRRGLQSKGYRIHGNYGDQWSDLDGDLDGSPMANRSFKLPNLMYYVA